MMIYLDDESEQYLEVSSWLLNVTSLLSNTIHAFLSFLSQPYAHVLFTHQHFRYFQVYLPIMAPSDDYSDSDESDVEDIQTNVLLGLPDGPISSTSDLVKPRISRIGGHPVYKSFNLYSLRHLILFSPLRLFLAKVYPSGTPKPPLSVSRCQSCSEPMELLVQLWCPFESSAFDRTLHIWACSRVQCQRKEGRCV